MFDSPDCLGTSQATVDVTRFHFDAFWMDTGGWAPLLMIQFASQLTRVPTDLREGDSGCGN